MRPTDSEFPFVSPTSLASAAKSLAIAARDYFCLQAFRSAQLKTNVSFVLSGVTDDPGASSPNFAAGSDYVRELFVFISYACRFCLAMQPRAFQPYGKMAPIVARRCHRALHFMRTRRGEVSAGSDQPVAGLQDRTKAARRARFDHGERHPRCLPGFVYERIGAGELTERVRKHHQVVRRKLSLIFEIGLHPASLAERSFG